MKTIFSILLITSFVYPQVHFDEFFYEKTLRMDYVHTGNNKENTYSFDELIEEPFWGGSKKNLIDIFNYGKYKFEVYDEMSGKLIYSRTFSTLFNEWQTTKEAEQTTKSFSETVVFPYPKKPVRVEFYSRNKENELIKKFEYKLDPEKLFYQNRTKQKIQFV